MWILLWLLVSPSIEVCNSTIFGMHNDKHAGGNARFLRRPIDPDRDIGVASRDFRMGTLVSIHLPRTGKTIVAAVIDAGPYGRIRPVGAPCPEHGKVRGDGTCWTNGAYEWRQCRIDHPTWNPRSDACYYPGSWWNGGIDLAPKAARLLGHDGWDRVEVRQIRFLRVTREFLLMLWGGGSV